MLTMSAKLYALALVGVLLGGCLGYGLGLFYTPPFLEGTFPDSYKERLGEAGRPDPGISQPEQQV
jgi:membrane protein YqaA with SNARE-associated domain